MVDPSSKTPESDVPHTVAAAAKPERSDHGNALQVGIGMASLVLKRAAKVAAQAAQAAGGLAQSGATTLAKATRAGATGVGATAQRVAKRTQELVVDFGRSYRAQIGVPEDEDKGAAVETALVEVKPAPRRKPDGSKASKLTGAASSSANSAVPPSKAATPRKSAARPKAAPAPAQQESAEQPKAKSRPKAAATAVAKPAAKSEPKAETQAAGAPTPAKAAAKPARVRKPAAPADGKPGGKPKASARRKPGTGAPTVH